MSLEVQGFSAHQDLTCRRGFSRNPQTSLANLWPCVTDTKETALARGDDSSVSCERAGEKKGDLGV